MKKTGFSLILMGGAKVRLLHMISPHFNVLVVLAGMEIGKMVKIIQFTYEEIKDD